MEPKSLDFRWDQMWNFAVPSKMTVAFVSQSALNGSYIKNPFNFKHASITHIGLYVDGNSVPGRPMKCDFGTSGNFVSAFANFTEGLETRGDERAIKISREDFGNGYTMFTFTLDPIDFNKQYINLVKQGTVRLEVTFGSATTETLSCIAFAQFPALLQIDIERNVRYIQP